MKGILEPAIARLLTECRAERALGKLPSDLADLLAAARSDLDRAQALLESQAACVVRSHPQATLTVEDTRGLFLRLRQALETLATASAQPRPQKEGEPDPLLDAAGAIEEAHSALLQALDMLRGLLAAEEVFSPFPTLNLAIKTGINVYDEAVEPRELDPWIERSREVVARLGTRVERFAHLHGDAPPGLVEAAASLVADLEAGIGALLVFRTRGGSPDALMDGLRLLRHPSTHLAALLEEMDEHARRTATGSVMPALEDLCRAARAEASGMLPRGVLMDVRDSVSLLAGFYQGQRLALEAVPLAPWVQDELESLRNACADLDDRLPRALSSLEDPDLVGLRNAFSDVVAAHDGVLARLEEEAARVASSPQVEELKELAGRLIQGTTTPEFFRDRVIAYLQEHARLEMELRKAAREVGGDAGEIVDLLHEQGRGLEEVTFFFRSGDASHLVAGIHQMEEAIPGLAAMRERLLDSLRPSSTAPRQIPCMACGSVNATGRRFCESCGARLPHVDDDLVTSGGGEDESEPLPQNLRRLEQLMNRFEKDASVIWEIEYVAGLYLDRLYSIRRDFESRFIPRLKSEASRTLIALGRDFYDNLTVLQQGLVTMLGYSEHGRADVLYRGFQECVGAGRAMRAAQERIENALRAREGQEKG